MDIQKQINLRKCMYNKFSVDNHLIFNNNNNKEIHKGIILLINKISNEISINKYNFGEKYFKNKRDQI